MKKVLLLFFTSLVFFGIAQPVQAHILATDNNIGAVLHVDPNDEPIAGSQASFFFEFKDKENKFDPKKCDCTFMILENGKQIFSQPLFQNTSSPSLTNASVFYTFPKKDVYQVKVTGKPTIPDAFQAFTLTWDFRVDQTATSDIQSSTSFFAAYALPISIAVIGFLILCGLFLRQNRLQKQKQKSQKGGEKNHEEKDSGTVY